MSGEFINVLAVGVVLFLFFYILSTTNVLNVNTGPSGQFIAKQNADYTVLAENTWASSNLFAIAHTAGTVGDHLGKEGTGLLLPFKSSDSWFGDTGRGLVEFTVLNEGKGNLVILLDGKQLYSAQTDPGKHRLYFDPNVLTGEDVLEFRAERGAAFWDAAEYDIKVAVQGEIFSSINTSFAAPAKYKKAELVAYLEPGNGKITVRLNGQVVFEGIPSDQLDIDVTGLLKKTNSAEFVPDAGARNFIERAEIKYT